MAKTIKETCGFLKERKEEITFLEGAERYQYILHIADNYERSNPFPPELKISGNKVPGCVSEAYVASEFKDGKMYYKCISDARTVFGYMAMLAEALSGLPPGEIVDNSKPCIDDFVKGTNVLGSLSPNRANAFGNVYRMMVERARQHL